MNAYIVSLSREAFAEIAQKLPPASRCVSVGVFPSPHYWLLDDAGNVIVLTPVPVERGASIRVENFAP